MDDDVICLDGSSTRHHIAKAAQQPHVSFTSQPLRGASKRATIVLSSDENDDDELDRRGGRPVQPLKRRAILLEPHMRRLSDADDELGRRDCNAQPLKRRAIVEHVRLSDDEEEDDDQLAAPPTTNRDRVLHSAIVDHVQIVLGPEVSREDVMQAIARVGANAQEVLNYLLDPRCVLCDVQEVLNYLLDLRCVV